MSGYVSKPVNRNVLLIEMTRVLTDRKAGLVDRDAESPEEASMHSREQRTEMTRDEIDLSDVFVAIERVT